VQLLAEAEGTRVQLLGHAVLEPSSELDTDLLAVLLTLDRRERAKSAPPVSPSPPARATQLQPIGIEPLPQAHGNMLRSIPPKQVPYDLSRRSLPEFAQASTKQDLLDARCGQGRFLASVMSHRATCTRCRCQLDLENPAHLWNAFLTQSNTASNTRWHW
jgi:hypothetical protein